MGEHVIGSPAATRTDSIRRARRPGGGSTSRAGPRARIDREPHTLPRQFWLLAAGVFVYLIGVEMCYPFETIFLNSSLGVSMTTVGLILGITLIATLPMQVVGGALADRLGRRPVLAVAVGASMTLFIGLGLSRQLWILVVLLAFEAAFGWAQFITASNAIVADLASTQRRAEAFSIMRVALNVGTVVGPLLAMPLIGRDPSFRLAFVTAGLVCGVFLVIVVFLLKESQPAAARAETAGASAFHGYSEIVRNRRFLAFCAVSLLPLYGFGQIWVTFPVMLGELHGLSAQTWGLVTAVYAAGTAILQYPVVRLLRRRDHMILMSASSACLAIGLGGSAFVPWPATFAFIPFLSLGIVLLIPISSTVVSRMAPVALRGRYMGAWTLCYMGGYALGPLVGGWALDSLGGHGAFIVVAAACILGAALFPLLREGDAERHVGDDEGSASAAFGEELRGERPEQAV